MRVPMLPCVALVILGLATASCSVRRAPTCITHEDQLDTLIPASRSTERDVWWPAAGALGKLAADDHRLRDRIWRGAQVNSLGMKFVRVEPGTFVQGPDIHRGSGLNIRNVELTKAYFMSVTEVTNDQFRKLFSEYERETHSPTSDSPATNISWEQAGEFCRLLSQREGVCYRLPTEAEWEYACRAGTKTLFSFGRSSAKLSAHACWNRRNGSAARVASFKPNAWGIYDMHGNALEWVSDWYSRNPDSLAASAEIMDGPPPDTQDLFKWAEAVVDKHRANSANRAAVQDPTGPASGRTHTLRGGAWVMTIPETCSSTARFPLPIFDRVLFSDEKIGFRALIGFRVVRESDSLD